MIGEQKANGGVEWGNIRLGGHSLWGGAGASIGLLGPVLFLCFINDLDMAVQMVMGSGEDAKATILFLVSRQA